MAGSFDYANARLRAMKAELLDRAGYERLGGRDPDGVIRALLETPYRPDVEAARARFRGLRCIHEALRAHLGRTIETVRGFFEGPPRVDVDTLLARFDTENIIVLLRGQARQAPADEMLALLTPTGTLDEATLREAASRPGVRAAVELLRTWEAPNPEAARALVRALPAYERRRDPAVLEEALLAAEVLRDLGRAADPALQETIRDRVDRTNILVALRLGEGGREEAPGEGAPFLPGGRISEAALAQAARAGSRAEARSALLDHGAGPWREALDAWVGEGRLPVLADALDTIALGRDFRRLVAGDPLGMGIPIAYMAAKENEVRNLRLIGHGASRGLAREDVAERLRIA